MRICILQHYIIILAVSGNSVELETTSGSGHNNTSAATDHYLLPLSLQSWVDLNASMLATWYPQKIQKCMLFKHKKETDIKTLYAVSMT
jgi:hypothetical protein